MPFAGRFYFVLFLAQCNISLIMELMSRNEEKYIFSILNS
ncbi:unknown [Prevotella sp. CAG:1124]|nr:unknown [Prevotella sp. CAG:1124]